MSVFTLRCAIELIEDEVESGLEKEPDDEAQGRRHTLSRTRPEFQCLDHVNSSPADPKLTGNKISDYFQ